MYMYVYVHAYVLIHIRIQYARSAREELVSSKNREAKKREKWEVKNECMLSQSPSAHATSATTPRFRPIQVEIHPHSLPPPPPFWARSQLRPASAFPAFYLF
uniref:Uncharacterized protein n=1 Tax=Palpitomonas bilix TaxID=652834 RepID=A0A7S3D9D0_9EUKA|mmetsp:Transcript_27164/g.70004  ORF Transcript_27164/g.70004 Transcript_27164/m.70004 type:complete len:102 (+) Transcript_27164:110-415(+)